MILTSLLPSHATHGNVEWNESECNLLQTGLSKDFLIVRHQTSLVVWSSFHSLFQDRSLQ